VIKELLPVTTPIILVKKNMRIRIKSAEEFTLNDSMLRMKDSKGSSDEEGGVADRLQRRVHRCKRYTLCFCRISVRLIASWIGQIKRLPVKTAKLRFADQRLELGPKSRLHRLHGLGGPDFPKQSKLKSVSERLLAKFTLLEILNA